MFFSHSEKVAFVVGFWSSIGKYPNQAIEVVVIFFNDRLMSTAFYPSDRDEYLNKLGGTGIVFNEKNSIQFSGVVIRKGNDYQGKDYIIWEDKGLIQEFDNWLEKNT